MESIKKRNPFLAGILSILTSGLGQVYNGQLKKGIIFFICNMIIISLTFIGILSSFIGLIFFFLIGIILFVWILIDAIINAIKLKNYKIKPYNRWYIYLLIIITVIIINNLYKPLIPVNPCLMKGNSMFPTIEEDERIVATKFYYQKHKLLRGDIIVFSPPDDPNKLYIKRVIAFGGESLEIQGSKIFINGREIKENWTPFLKNGKEIDMQKSIYELPQDTVFVLGDNLEQSRDSRDFGPIKLQSIKGKVLYIYWSKKWKKVGQSL